jgi:hypothetical protein
MSIFKRGRIYWYKFMWNGELVRESTKQRNDKTARNMESAHRTALANGLVGIRDKNPSPRFGSTEVIDAKGEIWCARRDSNSRPIAPEAIALSI